jgi:plastocyanin
MEETNEGYRPFHQIQEASFGLEEIEGSSDVRKGKGIRSIVAALGVGALGASFGFVPGVWSSPAKAAPKAAPPATVKVVDAPDPNQPKGYEPADITIKVGQAVNWMNEGNEAHTVTADDNSFDSGSKAHGQNWQHTFSKAGQFAYHCTPHPWMKGVVKVAA